MLPVVVLVGRPNVGKSTLFNVLTRSRDAIVADVPGLTRDRQYGYGSVGGGAYVVVDTGGLNADESELAGLTTRQTQRAIQEADRVLFLVDGREGLTPADRDIAELLRKAGKPISVVVNKTEGQARELAGAEFHELGLGEPAAISAAHGDNVEALMEDLLEGLAIASSTEAAPEDDRITVAIVGRPNVGKSTLINRLVREDRVVASDEPGTTRDSIFVPFSTEAGSYTLIDTAGVRRRARVKQAIEKFSVIKALQAIDQASVVIGLLDAREGVTDQDASLMGLVLERGRALVVVVNKWDGLSHEQKEQVRRQLDLKLPFLDFAQRHFISALHGTGVGDLMPYVNEAHAAAFCEMATPTLTRVLEEATAAHPPPLVRGRRIKLRYAHQGGKNPPLIIVHGNQTSRVPQSYKRYLVNRFRAAFDLRGTPVRMAFKSGKNPFAGRRNVLTPRQKRRKKRLLKHSK